MGLRENEHCVAQIPEHVDLADSGYEQHVYICNRQSTTGHQEYEYVWLCYLVEYEGT